MSQRSHDPPRTLVEGQRLDQPTFHALGLWLDPESLISADTRRQRAVVDRGCATPEHSTFVARLAAARILPRT